MATISSLYVKIVGDATGLTRALGLSSAQLKAFGVTAQSSSVSTVRSTAAIAAAYTAAGIVAVKFATDSIHAFEEQQNIIAQTNAVLKSTGGIAGVTADEVSNLAKQFQSLTTFSDEEVRSAENLLLTFPRISNAVFPQATQAVLDLSTALGQDLHNSAIQLGKALQDPILGLTALRRVGVAFDAQQRETIKNLVNTGHLMEAQKLILGELTKEFGGSAQAAAGTFAGKIAQLRNTWNDLQEVVGHFLVSVLQPLLPVVVDLIRVLAAALPVITAVGAAFIAWKLGSIIASIALFITELFTGSLAVVSFAGATDLLAGSEAAATLSTVSLTGAVDALTAAIAANPIGAFLVVVALGTAAVIALAHATKDSAAEQQIHAQALKKVNAELGPLADNASQVETAIHNAAVAAEEDRIVTLALGSAIGNVALQLGLVSNAGATTAEQFKKLIGSGADRFFEIMGTNAQQFGQDIQDAALKGTAALNTFVFDTLDKAKSAIAQWRADAAGNITGVSDVLSTLADKAHVSTDQISKSFKQAAEDARRFGKDLLTIANTGGDAGKALANALLQMGPTAAGLANTIAGAGQKTRDQIVGQFGSILSAGNSLASKLSDAIVGTLNDIRDILQAIAKHWGVTVDLGGNAEHGLNAIQQKLLDIAGPHRVDIFFRTHGGGAVLPHQGGLIPGTLRRFQGDRIAPDEVPAVLQRGEFVIRKSSVQRIGIPALQQMNRLHSGGVLEDLPEPLKSFPRDALPPMHSGGTPTLPSGATLTHDEVPVVLQRGEFVLRKSAVRKIGVPALQTLNRLHEGGQVRHAGGPIRPAPSTPLRIAAPVAQALNLDVRTDAMNRSLDETERRAAALNDQLLELEGHLAGLDGKKVQATVLTHYRSTGVQP